MHDKSEEEKSPQSDLANETKIRSQREIEYFKCNQRKTTFYFL